MSIVDILSGPAGTAAAEALRLLNTPGGQAAMKFVLEQPDISFEDLAKKVHEENKYTQGPAEAPDAPELPKGQ